MCGGKLSVLQKASPYWETVFSSGYSEGESKLDRLSQWKRMLRADVQAVLDECKGRDVVSVDMLEDSDGKAVPSQAEAGPSDKKKAKLADASEEMTTIRHVVVTDASFKTCRAVLTWLETGSVRFSLLRSSDGSYPSRSPQRASPKSLYALAHKLGIKGRQSTALVDFFSNRLGQSNALKELFSGHAVFYPEIAKAAMDSAVDIRTLKRG